MSDQSGNRRRGPQPQRYHHGDLRSALVRAARTVLEEVGVEGLSLRGVARQANVSQAAPYHHFDDKVGLLAAVAAEGVRELNERLAGVADEAAPPMSRLHRLGAAYVQHAVEHPAVFSLAQGAALADPGISAELTQARSVTFTILYDAITRCLPAASDARRREAFAAAWSMVHGAAVLAIDGRLQSIFPGRPVGEMAERIVEFMEFPQNDREVS